MFYIPFQLIFISKAQISFNKTDIIISVLFTDLIDKIKEEVAKIGVINNGFRVLGDGILLNLTESSTIIVHVNLFDLFYIVKEFILFSWFHCCYSRGSFRWSREYFHRL